VVAHRPGRANRGVRHAHGAHQFRSWRRLKHRILPVRDEVLDHHTPPADGPGDRVVDRDSLLTLIAAPVRESAMEAAQRASVSAGAEVDGADFLAGLTQAGLLQPSDLTASGGAAAETSAGGRRKIRWLEG
jgi:hypothetical protein